MAMLALGAAQAVTTVISAKTQADALKAQAKYEEQLAGFNAAVADFQRADAVERGERLAQDILKRGAQLIGQARAGFAGQGVRINVGTPLEIQQDLGAQAATDAQRARINSFREAFGFKIESINQTARGQMRSAELEFRARDTLLTGGAQAARQFGSTFFDGQGNLRDI